MGRKSEGWRRRRGVSAVGGLMSCVCPGGWGTVLYSRIRRREVYMEGGSLPCVLLVCSMTSGGRKGGVIYIFLCL